MVTDTDRSLRLPSRLAAGLGRLLPAAFGPQGRLFRKYAALFVALVGGALIVNSTVEAIYSYREHRDALVAVQREKARGAASVIEQFVKEIEGQLGWTTHSGLMPGQAGLDQRRFDYLRLLRQAPAVTEIAFIDPQGREQVKASRLAMDVIGSGVDRSAEEATRIAREKRRYLGPVYFRKESEPYMTMAIAGGGRQSGIAVAEVNLKFIWDVISRIQAGRAGIAYAVDERGLLIAHPDIGLVLRKTDLSGLAQVKAALAAPANAAFATDIPYLATDRNGRDVLTAHASVQGLGWQVFVEQPRAEALAPVYDAIKRTLLVLLTALVLAGLAGLWLARRMVVPIQALTAGAARIGAGDLDHRIEVKTGDEVEALADSFNAMGGQLKSYYAGLEKKVEERTKELAQSLEQQTATAQVLEAISRSPNQLQPVLDTVVSTAARLCNAPLVAIHVRTHDELPARARIGFTPEMVEGLTRLKQVYGRGSVTGRVALEGRAVHIPDVELDEEYTFHELTRITGARSILGVPMASGGESRGILLLYRTVASPFTERQIALLETFADQAVIAIENARLFEAEQTRTKELQESLEYQTATSTVLNVISQSPTEVAPVFAAIVESAAELCGAAFSNIQLFDGEMLNVAATHNFTHDADVTLRSMFPMRPDKRLSGGRAILTRAICHLPDVASDADYPKDLANTGKWRALLSVPMLRDNRPVGVITVAQPYPGPFSDRQIHLLETFADQAVIAINNVGLFEAEQARSKELAESLEYQTATSEVLSVISKSPDRLQPVLDAIAETASSLCQSQYALILKLGADGRYHLAASTNADGAFLDWLKSHPVAKGDGSAVGIVAVEGRTLHMPDALADQRFTDLKRQQQSKARTMLTVPLMKAGEVIGVIFLARNEVKPFTDQQVDLVTTFADQAVIAINNVRLFEEVQARTKELQESLEYQTATSEVLSVISRSPNELQPVLDAIVTTAGQLCGSERANIMLRRADGGFYLSASYNPDPAMVEFMRANPVHPGRNSITGRIALERRTIHIEDAQADPEFVYQPDGTAKPRRTMLGVPLTKSGELIGTIVLTQTVVRPFTERQIGLVETFADQAVIAIHNVGLFEEVQARTRELTRSVAEMKALGEVGQAVSSSLDPKVVLGTILRHACEISGTGGGAIYVLDPEKEVLVLEAGHNMSEALLAAVRDHPVGLGDTIVGRCARAGEPVQAADITEIETSHPVYFALRHSGIRAILAVPLIRQGRTIGVLLVRRVMPGEFQPETVRLLESFATQSAIAIHNARLFREIEDKSRQLKVASLHKSQFLANMSHELRTPLNAILGYTELIQDGIYGEPSEKTKGVLQRVQSNGRHLLGLINDVLDLSKIEAGQLILKLEDYALSDVIQTVVSATESLAAAKSLRLLADIPRKLPAGRGDDRRIAQVLLNLVGNAIKFTDAGEVRITARVKSARFIVKVIDTGPGIPESEHQRIFEEFHQVDSSNTKKKGGTGLGLAITKRIVELHGGKIRVDSRPGEGATFRVALPVRVERQRGLQ